MTTPRALEDIVFSAADAPTIVNEKSKFVVVTYWWGRNNLNQNIARPCVYFYEQMVSKTINFGLKYLLIMYSNKTQKLVNMSNQRSVEKLFASHISTLPSFHTMMKLYAKIYLDEIYADLNLLNNKDLARFEQAKRAIAKMSIEGTSPTDYMLMTESADQTEFLNRAKDIMHACCTKILELNSKIILDLVYAKKTIGTMKEKYIQTLGKGNEANLEKDAIKSITLLMAAEKKTLMDQIKQRIREKMNMDILGTRYENSNILDILNTLLRFRSALKFEDMIKRWELACAGINCNYMAVEYDYFSKTRQYQMAINAKPLFIKHALKLCGERAVVYIDGDMFVRKYPAIFDMPNVDFMSRGWNMDPRASYNIVTSIMYNPYKFETSGGIMYFSHSREARQLMDYWITETAKPYNSGKADDRILSMIFNAKKFLLNMTIIQLPVEYLWLTLDYDERMMEHIYDWDKKLMDSTIYIDHPECLTSEETAEGAGASSDRSPKLHKFLDAEDDNIPVSEEFYEAFMFPTQTMADQFKTYHNYMSETHYLDDGNPILYERKLVDPKNPDNNEYPMYITPFNKGYGPKQKIVDANMAIVRDELNETYWTRGTGQMIMQNKTNDGKTIVLCESLVPGDEYTIPMVIALMKKKYSVIYLPSKCTTECYFNLVNSKRHDLELVFIPDLQRMSHILKPLIDLSQPVYFHNTSELSLLDKALAMYTSLDEFSHSLNNGNYQVVSRIRIGYVFKKQGMHDAQLISCNRSPSPVSVSQLALIDNVQSGGQAAGISQKAIDEYMEGQDIMYGAGVRHRRMNKKRGLMRTQKKPRLHKRKTHKKQHTHNRRKPRRTKRTR